MQSYTSFWKENMQNAKREYMHRHEFESLLMDLKRQLDKERRQRNKYQGKCAIIQAKLDNHGRNEPFAKTERKRKQATLELKKLTSQIEKAKSEMHVQTTRLRAMSVSDKYRSKSAKVKRKQKLRTEHYGKNKNKDNEMLRGRITILEKHLKDARMAKRNTDIMLRELKDRDNYINSNLDRYYKDKKRLSDILNQKELASIQMFDKLAKSRVTMTRARELYRDRMKEMHEKDKKLKKVTQRMENYKEINENVQKLFVRLSQIVAKLRSRHRIYRNKSDAILFEIIAFIDKASKESRNKQTALEHKLICGSPIKGGNKGRMVKENRAHAEYLKSTLANLNKQIHSMLAINREDARCDAWKRLSMPKLSSIRMKDDDEKSSPEDEESSSRLSRKDLKLLEKLNVLTEDDEDMQILKECL